MSTMKNLGEEDFDFAQKKAATITDSIYGAEPPAAAGPAPPTSATDTLDGSSRSSEHQVSSGDHPEQGVAWAKSMIEAGKGRAAIKKVLRDNGIDPALAGCECPPSKSYPTLSLRSRSAAVGQDVGDRLCAA